MVKKERIDRQINKAKITKEALKNPLQSVRDIAKKTWIWKSSVGRVIKNWRENGEKDDRILWVCDKDFEIIQKTQELTLKKLKNPDSINLVDIMRVWTESTKRYMLFKWNATNNDWWLKELETEQINLLLIRMNKLYGQWNE